MCTSFVVHHERTVVGMNFDISARPIKLTLVDEDRLIVLQQDKETFYPAFGLNSDGVFMNLLEVEGNEQGMYRRGKHCIHIMRLFDELLTGKLKLSELHHYLSSHQIVNVPDYSVHSLICGGQGEGFIVEPGRSNIDLQATGESYMVLTNFPMTNIEGERYTDAAGAGADRFLTVNEELIKMQGAIDYASALHLLEKTAQQDGDYPTQLSLVFIPEEKSVYFTLHRSNNIYHFSFDTKEIVGLQGFASEQRLMLTKKGVLLSDLERWKS